MAYSDEHRTEQLAETIKRRNSRRMYKYEMFAYNYVNNANNATEAYKLTYPGVKSALQIRLNKSKMMKNPYILKRIEEIQLESLEEVKLTPGKLVAEYWYQYSKYKDEPKKWQAVMAALGGLARFIPKQADTSDQTKLPAGGVQIFINKQVEVGASMRQPDYEQIQREAPELLDVSKDEDTDTHD